jgi:excisionase family DNA binding protein
MPDELDQILTLDEMRGLMRVTRKTIVNGVREGRDLPPHFRCGRKILFRRSVVQAWIEAQEAVAKTATAAAAPGQEPGCAAHEYAEEAKSLVSGGSDAAIQK